MRPADLSHVDTWIFDLDNTLYPHECEFMALIDARMTEYVSGRTGLSPEDARTLQRGMLHEHGTTLAGLMADHGIDPAEFLEVVHDVSHDRLIPDAELRAAIAALPGRRLVFTNGSARHAERVLETLNLADLVEDVFHLEAADLVPKPQPAAYAAMVRRHGVDPSTAAFFEDSERNLAPAAALGMTTVLVGPAAEASTAAFVHHRAPSLRAFFDRQRGDLAA